MEEILENEDMKNEIIKALENENNEAITKLNKYEINKTKNNIFANLDIELDKKIKILDCLNEYRFIDDMNDFREGGFIRWINLKKTETTDDIKLERGAMISEIKYIKDDVHIVCKLVFGRRVKFIQILASSCLIFQKLTEQELIILSVLDYLKK